MLILAAMSAVVCSAGAKRNQCMVNGCNRYAPAGFRYCSVHHADGKEAAAKAAYEARQDRKLTAQYEKKRLENMKEEIRIAEEKKQAAKKLEQERLKQMKIEQKKFEQPLEGLFGHVFGEPIASADPVMFEPKIQFREFIGYTLLADQTGKKVGTISAYSDIANDQQLARRELSAVLGVLAQKYGRKLNKINTTSGNEVYALGFGAVDGCAHQMLQVTLRPLGKDGFRIVLSATVIEKPSRVIVEQSNDVKAL